LKFAEQFSRTGKSLEEWLKVLSFFSKLQRVLYTCKWIFFCFLKHTCMFAYYVMKKALFLLLLRSLLITYLITSSLEKEIILLEKKSGKSPEFWIRKSVRALYIKVSHFFPLTMHCLYCIISWQYTPSISWHRVSFYSKQFRPVLKVKILFNFVNPLVTST